MNKVFLVISLVSVQAFAIAQPTKTIKCQDAVYSILHQGCVLPVNVQRTLLASENCATQDDDQYFFAINGETVEYSIPACNFVPSK